MLYAQWQAGWDPARRAVSSDDTTLTYDDLHAGVQRAIGLLHHHGVAPGEVLALMTPRSTALLELVLAGLASGVIVLPLNDRYTPSEVRFFLEDAQPSLSILPSAIGGVVEARWLPAESIASQLQAMPPRAPGPTPGPDHPAMLMYTSGTTGRSKGALHSHQTLGAAIDALQVAWRWSLEDQLLHALPLYHVHGLVVAQLGAIRAGASARWLPGFDAAEVADHLGSGEVTVFMGVPTFYSRLLALPDPPGGPLSFEGVRLFTSGSAPLPPTIHARFLDRFGHAILERYGMTEIGIVTANPYDDRRPGSIGKPLRGNRARIVDPETQRVLPDGEIGELQIQGPSLFLGYRGLPEQTEAATAGGWMHTGDLGHRDPDGYLYLVGRRADLVLCGGLNVYPAEVEAALLQHPGVEVAAVVGVPDPDLGEIPVAAVVGTPGELSLSEWLRDRLAAYKIPRRFTWLDALPRNAMGKVLKRQLRGMLTTAHDRADQSLEVPVLAPTDRPELARLPLAEEIRALRRRIAGAEQATYQLAQVRSALHGLRVIEGLPEPPRPLPGAEILAQLGLAPGPRPSRSAQREALARAGHQLEPGAEALDPLLLELAELRRRQHQQLDRPEWAEALQQLEQLTAARDRAAARIYPVLQQARALPPLIRSLRTLSATIQGDPPALVHQKSAQVLDHAYGLLETLGLPIELQRGSAELETLIDHLEQRAQALVSRAESGHAELAALEEHLSGWLG